MRRFLGGVGSKFRLRPGPFYVLVSYCPLTKQSGLSLFQHSAPGEQWNIVSQKHVDNPPKMSITDQTAVRAYHRTDYHSTKLFLPYHHVFTSAPYTAHRFSFLTLHIVNSSDSCWVRKCTDSCSCCCCCICSYMPMVYIFTRWKMG